MKHTFEQKVYYGDTDAFGVVWHATYLRWLEVGRMELMANLGYDLTRMQSEDIVMTLPDLHVRYKSSAMLNDTIVIETAISKVSDLIFSFSKIPLIFVLGFSAIKLLTSSLFLFIIS